MEKQKTAMQQLIEIIEKFSGGGKYGIEVSAALLTVHTQATELLEAEKQIIKDAYDKGAIEQFNYLSNNTTGDFKTSDIYFTETFENTK